MRRVGGSTLRDAGDLAPRLGDARRMPLPATSMWTSPPICVRGGDGVQRRGLSSVALSCSAMTRSTSSCSDHLRFVLELATSSLTSATLTPAWRFGGSSTLSVLSRGAGSTPRRSGLTVSSGFFFAFMMFGSVA